MSNQKPTVFISHAGPDKVQANELYNLLLKFGIKAHLDQKELQFGDNVITWINDSIQESDYLLVLLSTTSIDRYWVKTEWSAALMKEADLRRTFVIPVVLPGLKDDQLPALLRSKLFVDLRNDKESQLLQLVNRLKQDEQIVKDHGRLPTPASLSTQESISSNFKENNEWISVLIYSNRFGKVFRFSVPKSATPSYLLSMLREALNLKWSNIDENLFVELSYTYAIGFNGNHLGLDTPISDAGVTDGSKLELWIRVTLTDLLENGKARLDKGEWLKGAGKETLLPKISYFLACRTIQPHLELHKIASEDEIRKESDKILDLIMNDRNFTSAQIALIAKRYFDHVDA
ncbi:MAG: toll/interleukin-1 receptor domain-containing protein [Dehalococcoidia bacterium]|nr:MAG: toll/interleukin-1 receptor domain-containing protein [Dehalococcoidia bacterium]